MNALTAVWISSFIGTILFIGAGFLLGMLHTRRNAVAADGPQPAPAADDGQAVREIAALKEQLSAVQARESQAASELASLRSTKTVSDEEKAAWAKEKAGLEQEITKLTQQTQTFKTQAEKAIKERDQAIALTTAEPDEEEEKTQVQPRGVPQEVQDRITFLEEQLQLAQANLTKEEKEKATINQRVSELQKQTQQAQAQKNSLQGQVADLQKRLQQAEKAAKKPAAAASAPAAAKQGDEVKALQELLDARKRELEQSLKTESDLRNTVAKLEEALASERTQARQVKPSAEEEALKKEVADLKARVAAADNKLAQIPRLEEEGTKLRLQLQEAQKDLERSKELSKVADEKHELVMKVEALKRKEAEVEELREERTKMLERVKEADSRLDQLKELENAAKERQELAIKVDTLKKQLEELERLREEKIQMADQLKEAEHRADQVKDLEKASKDRQDLAIKVEMLEQQLTELERLREENAQLKSASTELNEVQKSLKELQEENASLKSMGLVVQEKASTAKVDEKQMQGVGGSFETLLEKIVENSEARGAVLADEMGLLVAGIGNHAEALAALAALMSDTGSRAKVLLPFAALNKLSLVDENKLTVTAQPLQTELGHLIFATLTVGPGPDIGESMSKLLQAAGGSTPSS